MMRAAEFREDLQASHQAQNEEEPGMSRKFKKLIANATVYACRGTSKQVRKVSSAGASNATRKIRAITCFGISGLFRPPILGSLMCIMNS